MPASDAQIREFIDTQRVQYVPPEPQPAADAAPPLIDQIEAASDFLIATSGRPPPMAWFVPQWMPAKESTLLAGAGGGGKTYVALMLQAAGACAASWLGHPQRQFTSLGLYSEDGRVPIANRLDAIGKHYGFNVVQLVRHGMRVLPKPRGNVRLVRFGRDGEPSTTPAWDDLRRALDRYTPDLLVLDNVADYLPVVQFDNTSIRAARHIALDPLCHDYGVTILGLQNVSLVGLRATDEAAGSSGGLAWRDAFRSRLHLAAFRPDEDDTHADPDLRVLGTVKHNYAGKDQRLIRYCDGVFTVEDGAGGGGTDIRQNERWLKSAIIAHVQAGKSYSVAPNAGNYLPKMLAKSSNRPSGFGAKSIKATFERFIADDVVVAAYVHDSRRGRQVERIASVDGIQLLGDGDA